MKNWKPRIIELFRSRGAVVPDSPVLEELIQHLEELWRSALASGRSEEEAAAIVDAELAQLAAHTARFAATRAADAGVLRRSPFLGGAIYDVRHAWRLILSQPAFSAVVAVTLALGIGVSAAVLSLSAAVLLTPLPFPDSARLVALHATNSAGGFGNELSYLDFQDIRGDAAPFESVAAALRYSTTMLGGAEPVRVQGYEVTPDFLDVLRVVPAAGRSFSAAEGEPGGGAVAILSHTLWRDAFGADRSVLGRQVKPGDTMHTVVGVLPADFSLDLVSSIDLLVPTSRSHPLARSRAIRTYQCSRGSARP